MRHLILLLPILLVLNGCAYFAHWPAPEEAHDSLQSLLSEKPEAGSLWGDAWVRLENEEESIVFPAEFVIEYPDRIRMTAFGLFDRPEAYLASDGERIALYLVSENRYFSGPARGEALATVLGLPPMGIEELLGYLAGRVPVQDATGADLAADRWGGGWQVTTGHLTAEEHLYVSRLMDRIEGFVRTASRRKVNVEFSDFAFPKAGSERRYPHRIRVQAPEAGALFRVHFREMEINAPVGSNAVFSLRPPPGAIQQPFSHAAGLMGLPMPAFDEQVPPGQP